ncbi:HAD family hydrolase [Alkalibacillus almallahensis]|uniref:HAD family hydrolase n=1 Tax=Alkalibacillus almallahensis TaxID=1379154 RepID=UPI00141E8CD7|nr:HAD family hydrolase [Alkalibacillus almallahensis]NIK11605.1 putative hydrolase of the HAD superfamily [Alkalibacillus almallahensis]
MNRAFIEQHNLMIFDLDGTLYEGREHFRLHTNNLKAYLNTTEQQQFETIYEQVLNGHHPLQIGKVYDGKRDLIWTWDPFTAELTEAKDWNGNQVTVNDAPEYIPAKEFDFFNWVPIGDGWWPPYAIARHFGLSPDTIQDSYNKTKKQMSELDGFLQQTPGLKDYLASIVNDYTLIVCTNSDEVDAQRLLEFLELEEYFTELIPSAKKPVYSKAIFEDVLHRYQVAPEKAISIGDNFMNEIAPALQLGMSALWLTDTQVKPVDDHRLKLIESLSNL